MARLSYIKEIKNSNLLRLGIIEEEETLAYTVAHRVYSELGSPVRGAVLSDEALEKIKESDSYLFAKKKALSILAYADNNELTLRRKLIAKGVKADVAGEVVREMVSLGYINEDDQLRRLLISEANVKLYGALKIIPRLAAKGFSSAVVRKTLSLLVEEGEIDFSKNAKALVAKKLPADASRDEKRKILFKYGYKISGAE